jgi:hypothetical protein
MTRIALGSHRGGEIETKWHRRPSSPRGNLGSGMSPVSDGSGERNGGPTVPRAALGYRGAP